ncbi:MAG: alanine--tRNA ligase [Patescibacteria group bacterium]|nr:alanine--tRNA ligase [Patescibacteria group bacterium]
MKSKKIREKFINYFGNKLKHTHMASSSLIPANDSSVLLTTAGMQPFKPYYLGELSVKKDFKNRNLTSIQKCFRTSDIDSVGDASHLTFFEMMGNFSIGGYFKEEAIKYAFEFLVKELKLNKKRLYATVFKGDDEVVKDFEAIKIWQNYLNQDKISEFGRKENWWGPPGKTGPCGPSSEIHYDLTGQSCSRGKDCQPNCECGRFVEIWNLVFTQYLKDAQGKFKDLPTKNIDTGMGLERLLMIMQKKSSVFQTDLFRPIIEEAKKDPQIEKLQSEIEKVKSLRIIADHIKACVFLIADGVQFSNKEEGYILRRIFRRLIDQFEGTNFSLEILVEKVIEIYNPYYPRLKEKKENILTLLRDETKTYDKILKTEVEKVFKKMGKNKKKSSEKKKPSSRKITAQEAFQLYSTYGLSPNLIRKKGYQFNEKEFGKMVEAHKKISRAGAEKKFGGVGDLGEKVTKQHTATHLLHQALREVLGDHVKQMGSDLKPERLRFDFSHSQKMTEQEKKEVEDKVNEIIEKDLKVTCEEMPYEKAVKSDALSFFKEKYPDLVKVYKVGDFSKEICAGPHVKKTSEIGHFKIKSEKSSSKGVRRIKAVLE